MVFNSIETCLLLLENPDFHELQTANGNQTALELAVTLQNDAGLLLLQNQSFVLSQLQLANTENETIFFSVFFYRRSMILSALFQLYIVESSDADFRRTFFVSFLQKNYDGKTVIQSLFEDLDSERFGFSHTDEHELLRLADRIEKECSTFCRLKGDEGLAQLLFQFQLTNSIRGQIPNTHIRHQGSSLRLSASEDSPEKPLFRGSTCDHSGLRKSLIAGRTRTNSGFQSMKMPNSSNDSDENFVLDFQTGNL